MWWILFSLLLLIVWALFLILGFPLWVALVASGGVGVLALGFFVFGLLRERRAAKALEAAIAQQGAQQAVNARPERRAEIQELQKQVQSGISALKTSKLGSGRKSGAAALYSLPWYMIVGPPGAGKTTALKHSGLVFPFADPQSGGGVRGVGGTRNCDWWFTNEAILLDTAGRYATEQDDREEWMAFLQMLLRYRSRHPINGVFVAISITDIIDANEQQIEAMGKKLRARIDEVMTQLKMVVPVYLLFTKCDLIAGFSEFFGDLRKSDRAQVWGSTFRLDMPKPQPGALFEAEFDTLVKHLHARALRRLTQERLREAREKIYQFPLEFAGIKRNAAELVSNIFMVNAFQGTPIFRGFYFTSGTQEGRPLDRVLGRMGQAMGIRPTEQAAPHAVESKSYFLHDAFMKIAFPDSTVASRSQNEVRRRMIMRLAVSGAALSLAVIVAIPSVMSYLANRELLRDSEARSRAATALVWNDSRPVTEKLPLLEPLRQRLVELDTYRDDGPPLSMRWFMYQGESLHRPMMTLYVANMQQGFVVPCKMRLESQLNKVTGDKYLAERLSLKTYLMLSDPEHLDEAWATGQLTSLWAEMLRSTTNVPEADLKKALRPHVAYYLALVKSGKVSALPPDDKLVAKVRKTLQAVPIQKRYYDMFVNSLIEEKYDEAGDNTLENKKYPPWTINTVFQDRPDALKVLYSARYAKEKKPLEVEGPYTEKGHYAVVRNAAEGLKLLEREQWVVPLTPDESVDRMPGYLKRVAEDYDTRYIDQWLAFAEDITVDAPKTVKAAIELYGTLDRAEWPYLRILRTLEDHTQWKRPPSALDNKAANELATLKANQAATRITGLRVNINVDLKKVGERTSLVPQTFKQTVEFGIPDAKANTALPDTPLAKYVDTLSAIKNEMILMVNKDDVDMKQLNEKLTDAIKSTSEILVPLDATGRKLLTPLLMTPLKLGNNPKLVPPPPAPTTKKR